MPWIKAIPFDEEEVIQKIEDMCEPETIPRFSVINLQKIGEVAIKDAKRIIMKKENMAEACEDLRQEILNAWW